MPYTDRPSDFVSDKRGLVLKRPLLGEARDADPDDPLPGTFVLWMSDGTGSGDAGDIMVKTNVSGTVKLNTVADHSAGA